MEVPAPIAGRVRFFIPITLFNSMGYARVSCTRKSRLHRGLRKPVNIVDDIFQCIERL